MTYALETEPVTSWVRILDEANFQKDYFTTFSAIVAFFVNLLFPEIVTELIVGFLLKVFWGNGTRRDFIMQQYLPRVQAQTSNVHLGIWQKVDVSKKIIGVLIKLGYAFLFQEHFIKHDLKLPQVTAFFDQPLQTNIGSLMIPLVNLVSDSLTGFPQTDIEV